MEKNLIGLRIINFSEWCVLLTMAIYPRNRIPSILGPLLFVIAFNDITDVIKESSIIMYADDVVLYVAADDIKAINSKLSNDMESIADWMDNILR